MMTDQPLNNDLESDSELEQYNIRLLEEKLKIERHRRKVGEVIIRKKIETHIIEIPVRQEKLIIEQIGDETRQLAEINLSQETIAGIDSFETTQTNLPAIVEGKFSSLEQAVEILAMIARQPPHGCTQVQVKLVLEDITYQQTYQMMFQKYAEQSKEPATGNR